MLSQRKIAALSGVTQSTISEDLKGDRNRSEAVESLALEPSEQPKEEPQKQTPAPPAQVAQPTNGDAAALENDRVSNEVNL